MAQEDKIIFCTGGGCTAKLGAGVLSHCLLYTSDAADE